jgi:DNA uptake protein ComE-like DNA-binding protein
MVLLVLVGLVAALAPGVRMEVRSAGLDGDRLRAYYLARAGVHLALAALQADDANVDGLEDEWATLGDHGQTSHPLAEGQFRLEIIDASSRIDLNRADRETLLRLPGIDEATVDEILAWRGDGQAGESSSAANYEGLPRPYQLKGAPFDSVEELLLVEGVTPQLLYGDANGAEGTPGRPGSLSDPGEAGADGQAPWIDLLALDTWGPNRNAAGEARVDLNTATAEQLVAASGRTLNIARARIIVQRRARGGRFTSLMSLLAVPGLDPRSVRDLVDHVTVTPGERLEGRLNLNTAPIEALETMTGVTPEMAQRIVERRETEGSFESLGDLFDLDEEAFRVLADRVTTKSSVFLVRATGSLENGVTRSLEAWVRRTGDSQDGGTGGSTTEETVGGAQVMRWHEVLRSRAWDRWGWE